MAKRKAIIGEDSQQESTSVVRDIAELVNKQLKNGEVQVGTDVAGDRGVPYWIRSGIPQLDFAVGGKKHPGFPGARMVEIYGGEGAGKSTLAVLLTKMAIEQQDAIAYYQDVERVLTPEIIQGTGINMDKVMLAQPETLEDVFDEQIAMFNIIKDKYPESPVVVTLDSVAACSTNAEIEGEMGDNQVANQARLMSKGLRKIVKDIKSTLVLSIWVNQVRDKIGVMFGDTKTTPGGRALPFFASVRIELTKIKTLKKDKGDPYGCTIQAKIIKDKVAPPLRKAEYDILFIQDKNGSYPRVDIEGAVLDWCKSNELIGGGQGRYEVNGKSLYKDAARQELINYPDLMDNMTKLAYSVAEE